MRDGARRQPGGPPSQNGKTSGWKAIFNFTHSNHLLALIPALAFSICGGVLGPLMAIFLGKFFDAFADFGAGKISSEKLMDRTLTSVYALLGVGAGTVFLKTGMFAAWLSFGEMQAKSVRDELFQSLLRKDLEWFEMRESGVGTLLARLQTQIRELQLGTSQPMGFSIQLLVEGFVALGLSFSYGWKLTLVILASIPVSSLILYFISRGLQTHIADQGKALSEASKTANNAFSNISMLKYFNTQSQESRSYTTHVRRAAVFYLKQAKTNALQTGFVKFASTTMFVQGFWYGAVLVHNGSSTAGKVITIFWSALMAVQAFQGLLPQILVLAKARAAALSLRTVIETVNRGRKFDRKIGLLSPQFCDGDIEVRDISFSYPARPDHLVLNPSTFFFPAGETTFVVGKSGSGKSTVGSLLVRFYQPTSGRTRIDGNDLDDLSTAWLRNNITLVQQQSVLFDETIFKNIAFGHQYHDTVTHSQVRAGLELAALEATISDLPQGVDTKVGSGGSSLSGGQKQRVALARARLRDTPVLILDESTSALDYLSRTSVMAALRKWREHRTTIVITHDLTQIQDSDFVYVLEDGHVIAEGFRHNIEKVLQKDLLETLVHTDDPEPTPRPDKARVHGIVDDAESKRDFIQSPTQRQHRRDSLEDQVQGITITANLKSAPTIRRITRFSRYVGNRPSELGDNPLAAHPPTPAVPPLPRPSKHALEVPDINKDESWVTDLSQHITEVGARPMSMHQSIVLQSIPRNRYTGKPLASPNIIHKPAALRRMSVHRKSGFIELQEPDEPQTSNPQQPMTAQKILSTVWPLLGKQGRLQLIFGFAAVSVQAVIPPIFAFILTKLFETFYLPTGYKSKALKYSLSLLGVASADGVASFFSKLLLEQAAQEWVDSLRVEAMMRIVEQPRAWFDDSTNSLAYLTSALDRNAEEMRNLIGRFAALILVVVIMMTVSTIWALIKCWKLTLVAFSTAPAVYGLTKGFNIISSKWESRTNVASDGIGAIFSETFSDIRTVRTLTLESYFHQKYNLATSSAFAVGLRRAGFSGLLFGLSASSINFITALIFYYGAHLAKGKEFTVSQILVAFSLLTFSTAAANGMISYMPQLASSVDTGSRLLRLSKLPLDSHELHGDLKPDPASPISLSGPIQFQDLTFYYPARPEHPALYHINLTIPPRICTAVVGASGSGKSTIASLLLKLYTPSSGSRQGGELDGLAPLVLSGHDIRCLHTTTLRSMIAIVPQTPTIFPASVRDNICYGLQPDSKYRTTERVRNAAKQAGVHDFIASLPLEYETAIGEGGLGISGGQAQRLVIARALVRRPRILILDEPTSALDSESADIVKKSIQELIGRSKVSGCEAKGGGGARGMTVIVITHAKEMMEFADNVVVLEGGRLVEEGTYAGLLAKRGKLWEMLRAGGVAE